MSSAEPSIQASPPRRLTLAGCCFHPFPSELLRKADGIMSCFTYTFLLMFMRNVIFALNNNYKTTVYGREVNNTDLKQPQQSRSEHLEAASAPGNQPAHPEMSFCSFKPASAPRNQPLHPETSLSQAKQGSLICSYTRKNQHAHS